MKKLGFLLTGFILLIFGAGCANELENDQPVGKGEELGLTLDLTVPGITSPKVYALTDVEENKLQTIDILVFKENAINNETYLYHTHATNIDNNNGATDKKFHAKLQKSSNEKHRIVLIANARAAIDKVKDTFTTAMTKEEILKKISFTTIGKWNTSSANNFTPLPMWGQTSATYAITATTTGLTLGKIKLMRAVARIDVGVNMDVNDIPQGFGTLFNMSDVKVYNVNYKSTVAPNEANIFNNTATLPTLVDGGKTLSPNTYAHTPADYGFVREIYAGEANNKGQADDNKMACVVIGGFYTKAGDPVNTTEKTWYRLDFYERNADENAPQKRLDILRNHRYRMNISVVDGPGYSTEKLAFESRPINMKLETMVWDEGKITDMVFDGQYMFGVSQGAFEFSRDARTYSSQNNTLSVTTDYPTGWKIEKIVDDKGNSIINNWLRVVSTTGVSVTSGLSGQTTDVKLDVRANATGKERTGFIHFKAGRMTYVVKVTQSIISEVGVYLTDVNGKLISIVEFAANKDIQPAAQQFKLKWMPTSATVLFDMNPVKNPFTFATGVGLDVIPNTGTVNDASGTKTFTIQPPAITAANLASDPFYERYSTIIYTVTDGASDSRSAALSLRQLVYNLVTDAKTYLLNGSTYSLKVRSNTGWRIKSVTQNITQGSSNLLKLQSSDNLCVGTTGGYNTDQGDELKFTTPIPSEHLTGKITVVFESTAVPKKFNDMSVNLEFNSEFYPKSSDTWAGSNIYWDGTKLTFDDYWVTQNNKYQGVFFKWGSLYGISPAGNWDANILLYHPSGGKNTAASYGFTTWASLPYCMDEVPYFTPPAGKTARNRAYLAEITDEVNGTGDICQHLTNKGWAPAPRYRKWRMPTSAEYDYYKNATIKNPGATLPERLADGKTVAVQHLDNLDYSAFPLGGHRAPFTGEFNLFQTFSQLWTGTPYDIFSKKYTNAYSVYLRQDYPQNQMTVFTGANSHRDAGAPVRCVVDY